MRVLDALGLGVGTLRLDFKGPVFRPGDLIRGTVHLDLTEPVEARRLVVGLDARQRAVGLSPTPNSGAALSYRRDTVFSFHLDLDVERTYRAGESHRFELLIPEGALETCFGLPPGTLGDIAQVVSFLSPTKRFPLEWRDRNPDSAAREGEASPAKAQVVQVEAGGGEQPRAEAVSPDPRARRVGQAPDRFSARKWARLMPWLNAPAAGHPCGRAAKRRVSMSGCRRASLFVFRLRD